MAYLFKYLVNNIGISPSSPLAWVLAAFFYGYILTQLPGEYLATRFSGKHIYGIGVMVTSALTLLTYVAAQAGFEYLVVLRAIEGMFEVSVPLSQWTSG